MKYRTFGRANWQVSEISLGGAYLGGRDPEHAQENADAIIHRAMELGINYIDTAPYYGSSEELIGNALRGIKHSFYLATKVGFVPKDFDYKCDSVIRSIEQSLVRLNVPKISLVQIHEVNMPGWDKIMMTGYALTGLRDAQKRNLCEKIGITGRAIPLLAELAQTGEFDSVLIYHDYHPSCQLAAELMLPITDKQNMGVVIATVLAGGLYTDAHFSDAISRLPQDKQPKTRRIIERLRMEPNTLAQSAFRYVLADRGVSTIACGASNAKEIEEVAQASDMGVLSEKLINEIRQ